MSEEAKCAHAPLQVTAVGFEHKLLRPSECELCRTLRLKFGLAEIDSSSGDPSRKFGSRW